MTLPRAKRFRKPLGLLVAFAFFFVLGIGPSRAIVMFKSSPTPSPEVGFLPAPHAVRVDADKVKIADLKIVNSRAVMTLSDGQVVGADPNYLVNKVQASEIALFHTHVYQPSPTDPLPPPPYTLNIQHDGTDYANSVDLGPNAHDTVFMHIVNAVGCLDVLAQTVPAPLSTLLSSLAAFLPQACVPLTVALPPNPLTPQGASVFDLLSTAGVTLPSVLLTDLQADVFALTVASDNASPSNGLLQDSAKIPLLHLRVCDGDVAVADCPPS